MFKKIIFADDLSKRALKALPAALDLARKYDAELIILNVREDFLDKDEMVMLRIDVSDFMEKMKNTAVAARQEIERSIRLCGGQEVKIQILLQEGKPAREIVRTAEEQQADLIILGSHGTSLKEKVFGTTAQAVVRKARRSVLTIWTND